MSQERERERSKQEDEDNIQDSINEISEDLPDETASEEKRENKPRRMKKGKCVCRRKETRLRIDCQWLELYWRVRKMWYC